MNERIDRKRRSLSAAMLTGVDDEIAMILADQLADENGVIDGGDRGTFVASYLPERSIYHAVMHTNPALMADLERYPLAADAVRQVVTAAWEFAYRSRRSVKTVTIGQPRYVPALAGLADRLFFTIGSTSAPGEDADVIPTVTESLRPFIDARNAQLAAAYENAAGMADAAIATVAAIRQRAVRTGSPMHQIGIANGAFIPSADGGELRFDFQHRVDAPRLA